MSDEEVPIEARRLALFIGDWNARGVMVMDGKSAAINGQWRFMRAADGWGRRRRDEDGDRRLGRHRGKRDGRL
jgi:hypothetical protein